MSQDVREVIQRHHTFYEVAPYYVVVDERTPENARTTRMVKAGFDIDIFGQKASTEPQPSPDYELVYSWLRTVRAKVSPCTTDTCYIEVIPFESTVYFDPRHGFQEEALLRVRITHGRGLEQPAGPSEESALRQLEKELDSLGISSRR
jgi:hypothetical protein